MKRLAFITGSRADWGLFEPLIRVCREEFDIQLFVTGSHLSRQFGYTVEDIKEPITACVDVLIDSDKKEAVSLSQSVGLSQFATIYKYTDIDLLVVLGDRFELVPPVLAAYNAGIPVVHIQGDDTTLGSLDEGYRGCVRSLAAYHFTVREYGSLGCVFPEIPETDTPCNALVVYHPNKGGWEQEFYNIVNFMNDYPNVVYINSNADAGGRRINETLRWFGNKGQVVFPSLARPTYLALLKKADFIIGNSSSGLIEAPCLKTPAINVGARQRGRRRGIGVINCEGTSEAIREAIDKAKNINWFDNEYACYFPNPYYKPDTVKRMVEKLQNITR
jgi:GDP/UDP-N,N'-diacetylbacillosamine 2-epimerase (hydrolysing)